MEKKTVGRFEKIDLPDLELFNLDAKIDTGADTSSLHCSCIEVNETTKTVRFNLLDETHPDYDKKNIEMPVKRMKWVKSSNGQKEYRVYIQTKIVILDTTYNIELSLADRSKMSSPMLIGRRFLHNRFLVDVSKIGSENGKSIKLAILSKGPNLYSTKRLYEAAKQKGWEVEVINYVKCNTTIENENLKIFYNDRELTEIDAIIPRIGASYTFFGAAIVRQFELMDVFSANSSISITRARDKLRCHQILAKHGVGMPKTVFATKVEDVSTIIEQVGGAPLIIKMLEGTQGVGVVLSETKKAAQSVLEAFYGLKVNLLVQEFIEEAKGADLRAFVIDGKVVAAIKRQGLESDFRSNIHRGGSAKQIKLSKEERDLAVKAAKVMGLGIAGVDMLQSARGPLVMEVNASPGLEGIEKATGIDIAGKIMDYIEKQLQKTKRMTDKVGV
jgi:ribosomal protein S6--L-glutamate ligase